jgi:CRISPR-associated endonuclease/helicase Cas3
LAKSVQYGKTSLLDHTIHVKAAIDKLQKASFSLLIKVLLKKVAILHDLGKAHPHFQRRIQKINANSLADEREDESYIVMRLSSLAFLPVFPKEEWNILLIW